MISSSVNPRWVLMLSVATLMVVYVLAVPQMHDDAFEYQGFAATLVNQQVFDFSYYGFHGQSFVAALIYAIIRSPIAIVHSSILLHVMSLFLILKIVAYLYGERAGIQALLTYLLMPALIVDALRGHTVNGLAFIALLVIYLAIMQSGASPMALFISVLFRPFTLSLSPLLWPTWRRNIRSWFWYAGAVMGFLLVVLYFGSSWIQTGNLVNAWAAGAGKSSSLLASMVASPLGLIRNIARLFVVFMVDFDYNFADGYPSMRAMISPVVAVCGFYRLWKLWRYDQWIRLAFISVIINATMYILLVYSFPKYMIPAFILLIIVSSPYLMQNPVITLLLYVTSFPLYYAYFRLQSVNFHMSMDIVWFLPLVVSLTIWAVLTIKDKQETNGFSV